MTTRTDSVSSDAPFLVAAGGTGGHLFPAAALGAVLAEKGYPVGLVTDRRGKAFGDMLEGAAAEAPTWRIDAGSPSGSLPARIKGGLALVRGFFQARRLMKELKPRAVIGFGGYASAPACLAAARAGVPVFLHEQNALAGRVNRLIAPRARRIFTSFAETTGFPASLETEFTGNPVRAAFVAAGKQPLSLPDGDEPFRILVVGGSQGARIFADILPEAFGLLPENLRKRISLTQQTREEDLERCQAAYGALGMDVELSPFLSGMAERMGAAHLVICRCGASTLAEVTATGRPAILVPYPWAMDNHQKVNAEALARAGGGWVMPQKDHVPDAEEHFTGQAVADMLEKLFGNPQLLQAAAVASGQFSTPNAAEKMANALESLFSNR